MEKHIKKTIARIKYAARWMLFFPVNYIGSLLIPKIEEIQLENAKIIPYRQKYLADIDNIWNSYTHANLTKRDKRLLKLFGQKTCFLLTDKSENLIGFHGFYFNPNDLIKLRIHSAMGAIESKYRRCGYASVLFTLAYDSFRKTKYIRGISVRYSLNNIASRRIHEKYGFKTVEKYFNKKFKTEQIYAICDFHAEQGVVEGLNYDKVKP
ncbi:MAG: GNAT family N-acetyltransferase [Planctomycetota bacterium]